VKKLFFIFSILATMSAYGTEMYRCELSRANAHGIDLENVMTGLLEADKAGAILNLEAINGVSGVAIVTDAGLKVSLCDDNVCLLSDPAEIGQYQGISTVKLYDSYRVSIECFPMSNFDKSASNCEPNCHSQWNNCLEGCRYLPIDNVNSCYVGCNVGYDYCRARCE